MAQKRNLTVDKGSSFRATVTVFDLQNEPLNLDTYSVSGQIRRNYTTEDVVLSFQTVKDSDPATGSFDIFLDANATATVNSGSYVYDVQIQDAQNTFRVLEGSVKVTPRVTRN